jgi:ribosome-associated toxin RatA of RatAB toxin-antitoxin module
MKSIKFIESIIINKEPEEVFDYTQDYKNRLNWDTFLKQADLIDCATQAGKGVKAYCVAKNGIGMETVYVSYNRPKVTAVKMTKGPFMFKSFSGSWTFKSFVNGCTEVVFIYSFALRFPFSLLSSFITKNLQRNVKQRLKDLKSCLEM